MEHRLHRRVDLLDAVGQQLRADVELGVGLVVPPGDRAAHLVLLTAVLEHEPHAAIGEQPVRADAVLLRPRAVDAVEGEQDRLHERRLAGAVVAEDADHPGRQLEVDLFEHPEVAKGKLDEPHTSSPRASSR